MNRGDFSFEGWAIYSFTTANPWKLIAVANSIIYFWNLISYIKKKKKKCPKTFPAVPNCQLKKFRMTNLFHFFPSLQPEHREFCLYDPSHISAISTIINISELIFPKPDLVLSLSVALCEFSECAEVPLETSQLRSRSRARFSITAASPLP